MTDARRWINHLRASPWVVFAGAILTTGAFWLLMPPEFSPVTGTDYAGFYEPVARNIVAGRGLIGSDGAAAVRYPPGFPLLLAATFRVAPPLGIPESTALAAVRLAFIGLSAVFLFLTAERVWGTRSAWLTALLWMTYPGALWLSNQSNSEIPFLTLLFASFWSFWNGLRSSRRSWFVGSGVLAGLCMLVRPIGFILPVVFAVLIVFRARSERSIAWLAHAAALLMAVLVIVGPWEIKLYRETGALLPLSSGAHWSMRDGLTFGVRLKRFRQGLSLPDDVVEVMSHISARYPTLNSGGDVVKAVRDEWAANPTAVARLMALKAARSWYATDSHRHEGLTLAAQVAYLLVIGAATGACMRRQRHPSGTGLLMAAVWAITIGFWTMTTATLSILRYMVPAMGLLFLLIPALFAGRDCEAAA